MKNMNKNNAQPGSLDRIVNLPKSATLSELKLTINQESDCCAPDDLGNTMEIETPDGGAGKYITINGRWAMDDEDEIEELANTLKEVLRKSG